MHALLPGVVVAGGARARRGGRAAGRGGGDRDRPSGSGCRGGSSTILEGESLLNDATALVALRTAHRRRRRSGSVAASRSACDFVVAAGGGVLVGLSAFFLVVAWVRKRDHRPGDRHRDLARRAVRGFVAAEEIHASGVIAVVVAGLLLGHKAPILQTAQSRIAERMNWRTIAFVLENTVFLLIGLQAQLDPRRRRATATCRPAGSPRSARPTLVAVIVLRLVWVFAARYLLVRPGPDPAPAAAALDRTPSCSAGPACAAWSRWPRRS